MSTETDGGPAFPSETFGYDAGPKPGMSLRDWFAGQFATVAANEGAKGWGHICPATLGRIAECAYELADAMLAERGKAVKP